MAKEGSELCGLLLPRKSTSWHTALRLRKKSEKKDKDGKRDGKLENGYRKPREGFSNKVSVKVRALQEEGREDTPPPRTLGWVSLEGGLPAHRGSLRLALSALVESRAGTWVSPAHCTRSVWSQIMWVGQSAFA